MRPNCAPYIVYLSDRLPAVLARAWADREPTGRHAEVVAAAAADVAEFGGGLTVLAVARGGTSPSRLVLRTTDSSALSGAVAALTVEAQLAGLAQPGVATADTTLDPVSAAEALRQDPLVTSLTLE